MLCKSLTLWLHASVRQIQTWSAAWNGALQKAHFGAVMCCAVLCKAFLFFSGMWELEKCKSEFQAFPLGSDDSGWPCPQQSCSHPAWWLSWTPVLPANVHKMAKLAPVAVLDLCFYAILWLCRESVRDTGDTCPSCNVLSWIHTCPNISNIS